MSQVVLYGTKYCPYCIMARRLLRAKGIEFEDISVDSNPELRLELRERSGKHTVPQIWIGEDHVGGYTELRNLDSGGGLDALAAGG
ncbi:MAG: glutaredoxin 3 [Porticoccaceae bacterium]|jgi:glutaredoxin 3